MSSAMPVLFVMFVYLLSRDAFEDNIFKARALQVRHSFRGLYM